MGTGPIRALLVVCAGWLALWLTPVAQGQPAFPAGSTCHAASSESIRYASADRARLHWTCTDGDWNAAADIAVLRFDLTGQSGPAPTRFITRLSRFESMRITVIGPDGRATARDYLPDDMQPTTGAWTMSAPLPQASGPARVVYVEVERPRFLGILTDAHLGDASAPPGTGIGFELLIAALCGMLCMPLLLNMGFYRVLRQRFLMWHSMAVLFMLIQTLTTSGVVNRLLPLSLFQLSILSAASFGAGIAAAMLFAADLMEDGTVRPHHRSALRLTAPWIALATGFYLFSGESLRAVSSTIYYASWIPVMGVMTWVMSVAAMNGSRAVKFQMIAWAPFILMGIIRVGSSLGLTDAPMEMQTEQHLAIAFEVIVTALGVADRFLVIKRERDNAWAKARMLEDRIEHDPLTGLLNRHAIEHRFQALHQEGFRTVALLDLDHFKEVNDTFGHAVGDMVLRAVGAALAADEHTISIRLGGEEFMMLLSGPDPAASAERRRQAVALRIAAEVPGLDRLVTASMGLVEYGARTRMQPDFATAYGHCDRLLYDAKRAGRNRTMQEKVSGFAPPALPARALASG